MNGVRGLIGVIGVIGVIGLELCDPGGVAYLAAIKDGDEGVGVDGEGG